MKPDSLALPFNSGMIIAVLAVTASVNGVSTVASGKFGVQEIRDNCVDGLCNLRFGKKTGTMSQIKVVR